MKIQNLTIIFIIITIPIVLIFSFYLNLETKTITLQTSYDEKLIEATKEAVGAFEINTVDWNSKYSSLANVKRQHLMSSINVFTTSLASKLGIGGNSKEDILSYIPAIVYIMYDGYYIYSPTHIPKTITNENGVQLFYYRDSGSEGSQVTSSATQNIGGKIVDGEPMYVYGDGRLTGIYNGKYFTTDISSAEKVYKHVLKTFVPYTSIQEDYIINYTLDNYIRIYGEIQSKEGYIIEDFGGANKIEVPVNNVSGIKAKGNDILPEVLTENIYIRNNTTQEAELKTYPYIYNSNNDKRYYDSSAKKFFMLNDDNVKVYLPDSYVGHTLAEYKKVLVRTETANYEYIELYQLLNSDSNDTNWYYKEGKNKYLLYEKPITGINRVTREKDCSAINYYVETCNFNHWLKDNDIDTEKILNDRKNDIIKNINNNLNLSISNYNANSKRDYKILELSDEDWEQALSNISMITFFEGIKTGLKTYNNYAIVTSTENNEYVSEESLYYIGENGDKYYHRYYCGQGEAEQYQAYRNTDFKVQSYDQEDEVKYYYKHKSGSEEGIQECFDCIVNRNNYEPSSNNYYDKTFYIALGRERYVQMSKINLIINLNKKITVIFDKNGGNCSTERKEVTYNSTYGTLPIATKDGREFAGWYTSISGGNKVISETKVTEMKNPQWLYARWSCTVEFEPNGGTCEIKEQQVIEGNRYGELPLPTRTGYNFAGWYTTASGGTRVEARTPVPDIGNHTLYAHWTPAQYRVTFDARGGTCGTSYKDVTYGSTYGSLPTPTKAGYTFAGWYTTASGGTKVTAATTVNIAGNHTLYAYWNRITYTISYNANGGNGAPSNQTKNYGEDLTLSSTRPRRTGYEFLGWSTSSTATTAIYQPGGKYTANSSATLYAVWNKVEYTVTFNANGGNCNTPNKKVTVGSEYGPLPTPTKTGHTFAGWYTLASGGSQVTSNTTVTTTQNHTLYAHWTTNSYTVTFNHYKMNGNLSTYILAETSTANISYGTTITISNYKKTYTGFDYSYASNTSSTNGSTSAITTKQITGTCTISLYYSRDTYEIKYNANGGSGAPNNQTKIYGVILTLSSKIPTKSGYTFLGWSTSSTATTASYQPGGTYTTNSGATLYAVWQQVIEVTSITLNQTTDQWIPLKNNGSAGTLSITATVTPSNATNKTVTWTSSNEAVATVSSGLVTAKGAGVTTITATAGGKTASVNVYVYNAVFKNPYNYKSNYTMYNSDFSLQSGVFEFTAKAQVQVIIKPIDSPNSTSRWELQNYKIVSGTFTIKKYSGREGQFFKGKDNWLTNYGAWKE